MSSHVYVDVSLDGPLWGIAVEILKSEQSKSVQFIGCQLNLSLH